VNLLARTWPQRGEPEADDYVEIAHALEAQFGIAYSIEEPPFRDEDGSRHLDADSFGHALLERLNQMVEAKREEGRELKEEVYAELPSYPSFDDIVRDLQLQILDAQWKAHLHTMDSLRESISLRGYAQRDPKIEYQREGFELFGEMEQRIDDSLAEFVFKFVYPRPSLQPQATTRRVDGRDPVPGARTAAASKTPARAAAVAGGGAALAQAEDAATAKVGRNSPCPCGSGKKYKKCCGA